jgi:hypothetical protein
MQQDHHLPVITFQGTGILKGAVSSHFRLSQLSLGFSFKSESTFTKWHRMGRDILKKKKKEFLMMGFSPDCSFIGKRNIFIVL